METIVRLIAENLGWFMVAMTGLQCVLIILFDRDEPDLPDEIDQ